MAKNSSIEWCHHTFNPWWGCVRVSPGCVHCYAETFDRRVHGVGKEHWGVRSPRRFFGDKHWNEPLKWSAAAERAGERHRVFCASMADVFEDREDLTPHRRRLFYLIEQTPALDWLLLTKRPENVMRLVPLAWRGTFPGNVWMGTSAEDQQRADERIPALLGVPAVVRFLSCEPLLGPVDLLGVETPEGVDGTCVDWVIVGGESGGGSRGFNVRWARTIVEQCRRAGVPVFVKQLGARPFDTAVSAKLKLRDKKGGWMDEWPEDVRVREFPQPAGAA